MGQRGIGSGRRHLYQVTWQLKKHLALSSLHDDCRWFWTGFWRNENKTAGRISKYEPEAYTIIPKVDTAPVRKMRVWVQIISFSVDHGVVWYGGSTVFSGEHYRVEPRYLRRWPPLGRWWVWWDQWKYTAVTWVVLAAWEEPLNTNPTGWVA